MKLKPSCMGTILGYLLDHKNAGAKEFAELLVSSHATSTGDDRTKAVIAASELINRSEDVGWSTVWPAIQSDIDYGQEIIAMVARNYPAENLEAITSGRHHRVRATCKFW